MTTDYRTRFENAITTLIRGLQTGLWCNPAIVAYDEGIRYAVNIREADAHYKVQLQIGDFTFQKDIAVDIGETDLAPTVARMIDEFEQAFAQRNQEK